jgi:hypothetical protein
MLPRRNAVATENRGILSTAATFANPVDGAVVPASDHGLPRAGWSLDSTGVGTQRGFTVSGVGFGAAEVSTPSAMTPRIAATIR